MPWLSPDPKGRKSPATVEERLGIRLKDRDRARPWWLPKRVTSPRQSPRPAPESVPTLSLNGTTILEPEREVVTTTPRVSNGTTPRTTRAVQSARTTVASIWNNSTRLEPVSMKLRTPSPRRRVASDSGSPTPHSSPSPRDESRDAEAVKSLGPRRRQRARGVSKKDYFMYEEEIRSLKGELHTANLLLELQRNQLDHFAQQAENAITLQGAQALNIICELIANRPHGTTLDEVELPLAEAASSPTDRESAPSNEAAQPTRRDEVEVPKNCPTAESSVPQQQLLKAKRRPFPLASLLRLFLVFFASSLVGYAIHLYARSIE